MKYADFDIIDFLQDEFFIKWVKKPTDETNHFWNKWLEKHPEKRQVVAAASEIIRSTAYQKEHQISDEDYLEIYENIASLDIDENKTTQNRGISWNLWKKLIAAVIIFGGFYLGYKEPKPADPPTIKQELVAKHNPCGRKSSFLLSDGSRVYLNSKSTLTFPKHFSDSSRVVCLKGEAFFEVVESKEKPFLVRVGKNTIRVMGTSFNVKRKDGLSVALVSGKVAVEDDKGSRIILQPREMLIKDQTGDFHKTHFDQLEVTGWKDKYLVFKEDSFDEIKEKLENWFGVEVRTKYPVKGNWSYSGVFHKESLEHVMEGISITSNFTYTIKDKTVIINNPN